MKAKFIIVVFMMFYFSKLPIGEAAGTDSYILKTENMLALQKKYSFTLLEKLEEQSIYHISSNDRVFEELQQDDQVEFIEKNTALSLPVKENHIQSRSTGTKTWGYESMSFPALMKGEEIVKVAVLDTGVDSQHPELLPYLETGYNVFTDSHDAMDDHGHGTHVTGIITHEAPEEIRILPVKMLNRYGYGDVYSFVEAVYYAISQDVDVINISLGMSKNNEAMKEAVNKAAESGITIIAASGNEGKEGVYYPAKYEEVIGVGAYDALEKMASFSQYGDGIDFLAPGTAIWSTYPGGTYRSMGGTSMASGFVTKAAATLMAYTGQTDQGHIRELMKRTSTPIEDNQFSKINVTEAQRYDHEIQSIIKAQQNIEHEKISDETKPWTIHFNMNLDKDSVTNRAIYIVNQQGVLKKTSVEIQADKRAAKTVPLSGYSISETYYLVINDQIKSETNKKLKSSKVYSWSLIP